MAPPLPHHLAYGSVPRRFEKTQIGKLRLLEICVDIDRVERDEAREPLLGLDQVANLHGAITDYAVERRADHGKG